MGASQGDDVTQKMGAAQGDANKSARSTGNVGMEDNKNNDCEEGKDDLTAASNAKTGKVRGTKLTPEKRCEDLHTSTIETAAIDGVDVDLPFKDLHTPVTKQLRQGLSLIGEADVRDQSSSSSTSNFLVDLGMSPASSLVMSPQDFGILQTTNETSSASETEFAKGAASALLQSDTDYENADDIRKESKYRHFRTSQFRAEASFSEVPKSAGGFKRPLCRKVSICEDISGCLVRFKKSSTLFSHKIV